MASKKSKKALESVAPKALKAKTKTPSRATRKGMRGGSVPGTYRECGVCHKTGHNARSHGPGGKLAKR